MLKKSSRKITKKKSLNRSRKKVTTRKRTASSSRKRTRTMRGIEYVLPLGNGWVVKNNVVGRFTAITDSKKEAISIARGLAQTNRTQLVVHGRDGNIEIRESY
jgi:hypothetical protein